MKCLDKDTKKDLLNQAIYWLIKPWVFVLVFAFIFTPSCKIVKAIESGADFLNIGAGARPAAMAFAFTAVSKDINSVYFNPAGLAAMDKKEFSLMHADWFIGGKYDFACLGLPIKNVVGALSVTKLSHGGFETRDANRYVHGSFQASDRAIGISMAKFISRNSSIGAGVKFLSSEIAGYSAQAVALDLGLLYNMDKFPVSFGMAVRNIGRGMKFIDKRENLPLSISAGLALRVLPLMNVNLDVKRLIYDKETSLNIGTEYNLFGAMFLRGGYSNSILSAKSSAIPQTISGGIGLKISDFQVDYAFTPFDELNTSKKISLSFKF
jgi:hypothetical protein